METFASKVREGRGSRFDPMLEEGKGWNVGEVVGRDVEVMKKVIKAMAESNKQTPEEELNPFKGNHGEIPPKNVERNFNGFRIRKNVVPFKVNSEKLVAHIALLKEHIVIAKFLGPKPTPQILEKWLETLNQAIGGCALTLNRNVGRGCLFIAGSEKETTHKAMRLSPFKSKLGTCMLQSWLLGFNPENPSNLAFPTWISLRNLSFEHFDQAKNIVESLGEVIGMDLANEDAKDPKFCINLLVSKGWVTSIALESEERILPQQVVDVDYDSLPIGLEIANNSKMEKKKNEWLKQPRSQ